MVSTKGILGAKARSGLLIWVWERVSASTPSSWRTRQLSPQALFSIQNSAVVQGHLLVAKGKLLGGLLSVTLEQRIAVID